jgi:hypothetical protein
VTTMMDRQVLVPLNLLVNSFIEVDECFKGAFCHCHQGDKHPCDGGSMHL